MARDIPFSELTTLRVGGPAGRLVTATTQRDLVDLATEAWEHGVPWLALGGHAIVTAESAVTDASGAHVVTAISALVVRGEE